MTGLSAPKHITKFCVLSPIDPIRKLGRYSNVRCIPRGAGVLLRYCSPHTRIPPASAAVRSRVPTAAYSTLHNENALPSPHAIAACEADLLIIDATNLACIAAADRAYLKPLNRGASGNLHAVFADWLCFLRRVVRTRHAVAVFDEPRVRFCASLITHLSHCPPSHSRPHDCSADPKHQMSGASTVGLHLSFAPTDHDVDNLNETLRHDRYSAVLLGFV